MATAPITLEAARLGLGRPGEDAEAGRPGAAHRGPARPPRAARRASSSSGRSESAAGWRSFCEGGGKCLERAGSELAQAVRARAARARSDPVGLGVHLGRGQPLPAGQQRRPMLRQLRPAPPARRAPSPARGGARSGSARRPPRPAASSRSAATSSGRPASSLAARSAAAASALPPPSPAATGIRFSIITSSGGQLGTHALAEGAPARGSTRFRR